MNHVLERVLTSQVVSDGESRFPLNSHISPEEGKFLGRVIAEVEPETSLEAGRRKGLAKWIFCLNPKRRFYYKLHVYKTAGQVVESSARSGIASS